MSKQSITLNQKSKRHLHAYLHNFLTIKSTKNFHRMSKDDINTKLKLHDQKPKELPVENEND